MGAASPNRVRLVWQRPSLAVLGDGPDGRSVAVALDDNAADVLTVPSGRVTRKIHVDGSVTSVAFAPDGTLVTGTWSGIVQFWNVKTGAQLGHPTLASPAPIASLAFNPGGDTFSTTGGSDGSAKLWTTATEQQFGSTFQIDPTQWGAAQFTRDGYPSRRRIRRWDRLRLAGVGIGLGGARVRCRRPEPHTR